MFLAKIFLLESKPSERGMMIGGKMEKRKKIIGWESTPGVLGPFVGR